MAMTSLPLGVQYVLATTAGFAGILGIVALVGPRLFAVLARAGGYWIDTSRMLNKLDTRIEVDARLLPYSRLLGASVITALGVVWLRLGR